MTRPEPEDLRDTRGGTYDPINDAGRQQPHQVGERTTPHALSQPGADVRGEPEPGKDAPMPDGLRRAPKGPVNPRRGRDGENG